MGRQLRGKAAIVGIGELPTGHFLERSLTESAVDAAVMAIRDSGMDKGEIDTIIPIGAISSPLDNNNLVCSYLIEELGLGASARANFQVMSGGSSSSNALKVATALLATGLSRGVLIVHSDRMGTGLDPQVAVDIFSKASVNQEYEIPYGWSQLGLGALIQQRYMFDSGTTERQIAAVIESLRKWAALNPNAMIRSPRSADEVLASEVISSPVRKRMMNVLADGAAALVVTSSERAKDVTANPAYVLGMGSRCTNFCTTQQPDDIITAWKPAAQDAYAMVGIGPGDVNVAEIYDAFPSFVLMTMEMLGLCEPGEAGAFVEAGHTSPGGKLPVTTNGGMLAQGHTGTGGGMAVLVEAARQVMGKAGERQVPGVDFAVETASGGVGMDLHVAVLGKELGQ